LTESINYKFYTKPELKDIYLLVCWKEDAAKIGQKVGDYLNAKLSSQLFAEIDPELFFNLGGVLVEDNIAMFPGSKFYYCPENNLVILNSNSPRTDCYKFLNLVLDLPGGSGRIREVYTIGSMVTLSAHTAPRSLMATVNSVEMKTLLGDYDLIKDMDYETPQGQKPTMNSYLLWVAKRRNIPGAAIWVPVPFYLVSVGDPRAFRKTADFLNKRFNLGIDLSDIDEEIHRQNAKIATVANQFPVVDEFLHRLESNIRLSDEENNRLIRIIEENMSKVN
jgi:proteasome assembly chaperone (PAC2) family protein